MPGHPCLRHWPSLSASVASSVWQQIFSYFVKNKWVGGGAI
jgi:hypothetical protein